MAYRLLFFVGHFDHDGNFASTQVDMTTKMAMPVVKQPLDETEMRQSAIDFCGGDADRACNWDAKVERGQIVFCEFHDAKALAWVNELIRSRNVDVIDGSTMRVVPPTELMLTLYSSE